MSKPASPSAARAWTLTVLIAFLERMAGGRRLALAAAACAILGAAALPLTAAQARSSIARIHYPPGRYPVMPLPNGQRRSVRSLLDIQRALHFGESVWDDAGVPPGPVWIRVDLALQTLSVFRSGHEIGTAVILYGADGKPTPPGVYPILGKAVRHRSNLYDADMPYMLRLTGDGIAIHASDVRASAATHGCIGVPLAFARQLFAQVRRGDPVAIVAP